MQPLSKVCFHTPPEGPKASADCPRGCTPSHRGTRANSRQTAAWGRPPAATSSCEWIGEHVSQSTVSFHTVDRDEIFSNRGLQLDLFIPCIAMRSFHTVDCDRPFSYCGLRLDFFIPRFFPLLIPTIFFSGSGFRYSVCLLFTHSI